MSYNILYELSCVILLYFKNESTFKVKRMDYLIKYRMEIINSDVINMLLQ